MSRIDTVDGGNVPGGSTNPFRYGYRDVLVTRPDGSQITKREPLTLEDLLHPRIGDCPVQSSAHERDCRYLGDALQGHFANRSDVLVFCDVGIYWDIPELDHHSPDVSLIFGVQHYRESWASFNVAEEGRRPVLLIEVVSPDYRDNDTVTKVEHYHLARVPFYVIVDREQDAGPPRLIGYRYSPAQWIDLPLDDRGRLRLDPLGVLVGTRDNRAVLYNDATGAEIGDYVGVTQTLEAEIAARQEAERRAQGAERRAQREATARQEAEQRAEAAEARLRELEEELRRRNGPPPSGPTS
jgi:Uma2 family endonuclease